MRIPVAGFVALALCTPFAATAAEKKTKKAKAEGTIDFSAITSPIVLKYTDASHYRDPAVVYHDGVFRLFFTVTQPRKEGRSMVSFLGTTTSRDLIHWRPVRLLTEEAPKLNYSSPGNVIRYGGKWIICFQSYPIPRLGYVGDRTARLFIMRSDDLEHWSKPELLRVKGPAVPREKMGRMIDPYLIEDKDQPGKWWCFYKQSGVSMSWTRDFKTWRYHGRTRCGENVCVWVEGDEYVLMHSPRNGLGIKRSKDLRNWREAGEPITLGQKDWPWAAARLTAGAVLDLRDRPRVAKALLFFHGAATDKPMRHVGKCSIGMAWSDDLKNWSWPGKKKP